MAFAYLELGLCHATTVVVESDGFASASAGRDDAPVRPVYSEKVVRNPRAHLNEQPTRYAMAPVNA